MACNSRLLAGPGPGFRVSDLCRLANGSSHFSDEFYQHFANMNVTSWLASLFCSYFEKSMNMCNIAKLLDINILEYQV